MIDFIYYIFKIDLKQGKLQKTTPAIEFFKIAT